MKLKVFCVSSITGYTDVTDPVVGDYRIPITSQHFITCNTASRAKDLFKEAVPNAIGVEVKFLGFAGDGS